MEHCPEHSGLVEAINNLKESNEDMSKALDKLTGAIINMKIETAKTSARVGARVGVKWGSIATGSIIGLYKIIDLIVQNLGIPK